jgi:hypothetical protein
MKLQIKLCTDEADEYGKDEKGLLEVFEPFS